jgi:ATP-dependent DNA helicase DinG
MSNIVDVVSKSYGKYISSKGWSTRQGQSEMMTAILNGLQSDRPVIVEAGTGVGKTIAYSLPSILYALKNKKRVVISTATVALQEQLIEKDLPDLKKHSGLKFSYSAVKGRRRYVCTDRLMAMANMGDGLFDSQEDNNSESRRMEDLLEIYTAGEWDGDRDSIKKAIPDHVWSTISTDNNGCYKKLCSQKDNCPFFKARDQITDADVIVANHALVFSDLAVGGGVILPKPDETIYVFDEFHHVPDTVIRYFEYHIALDEAAKQYAKQKSVLEGRIGSEKDEKTVDLLKSVISNFGHVAEAIRNTNVAFSGYTPSSDNIYRFKAGLVDDGLKDLCKENAGIFQEAYQSAKKLLDKVMKSDEAIEPGGVDPWMVALGTLVGYIEKHAVLWKCYAINRAVGTPPIAKWISFEASGLGLHASPVEAGKALETTLWKKAHRVVGCSATLRFGGNWERLDEITAMPENAIKAVIQSPFNYEENVRFNLKDFGFDPSQDNIKRHNEETAKFLDNTLNWKEGNLVLFASHSAMNDVLKLLPAAKKEKVMMQGSLSKSRLLRNHRSKMKKKEGSTLFGVASFSEGIDLSGDLVTHVVITKLAFDMPKDPVKETLCEYIKQSGSDPFKKVSVPDATVRLIQACGRLIRSETDKGTISILDRRIKTKYYGAWMLKSIPMLVSEKAQVN